MLATSDGNKKLGSGIFAFERVWRESERERERERDIRKGDSFIVVWLDGDWSLLERSPGDLERSAGSTSRPRWKLRRSTSSTPREPSTRSQKRDTPKPGPQRRPPLTPPTNRSEAGKQ